MLKLSIILIAPIILSACFEKSPGEQCLDSFKFSLKDPNSGKVIDFKNTTLTYTATNSYGARTQGKALCKEDYEKKWVRDKPAEMLAALDLAAKKLENSNECRKTGKKSIDCTGNSAVLKQSARSLAPINEKELIEESSKDLGFE